MITMKTKASNGLTAETLAEYARRAYLIALGQPFSDMPADEIEAWTHAAIVAIDIIDMPADEWATREVSAKAGAEAIYRNYVLANEGEPAEFDSLDQTLRLAWEAAFRHLANWIDSDGTVDLSETEAQWRDWLVTKSMATA